MHQEFSNTWRTLKVPDWSFGGLDLNWYKIGHNGSQLYVILELYPNFSSLARIEVHQEHSHTWRMLMVPDMSFGGLDCL